MTQYSTLNLKLYIFGSSNYETNFPHKLLLTNMQVSEICKAFANGSSANIKISKTQSSGLIQLVGFVSRFLRPLLKSDLPSGFDLTFQK